MRFEKALQSLSDAEVEFVVIGGVAAALHGSARATWDVDICFSRATINLRRLAAALAPFHPRLRDLPDSLTFVWDEATLSNGTVFALLTDLGKIDLLAEVAGVGGYEEARAHSVIADAFGRRIAVLDPAHADSVQARRRKERDLSALPELEALLEASAPDSE